MSTFLIGSIYVISGIVATFLFVCVVLGANVLFNDIFANEMKKIRMKRHYKKQRRKQIMHQLYQQKKDEIRINRECPEWAEIDRWEYTKAIGE